MADFQAADGLYRIIDVLYRLHRDLFEIENVVTQTSRLQIRLSILRQNSQMGVLVAGILSIVPILVTVGNIRWDSAPAVTLYCIGGAVVLLWVFQIMKAGDLTEDLEALYRESSTDALDDRGEFMLEEVSGWCNRYKLVLRVIKSLHLEEQNQTDAAERQDLEDQRVRYEEIARDCENRVEDLITRSDQLVGEGKRSNEEHDELVDWAAAIPKFANKSTCTSAEAKADK